MSVNHIPLKIRDMENPPTDEFHRKKMLLNEDFKNNAKIQGLVSYIYYPSQKEFPLFGHGELEIEGNSYTLMSDLNRKVRPLSKMIHASLSGTGFPFLRFNVSVTPNQLSKMREFAPTTSGFICSMSALKPLSQYADFKIPLPFTISPLMSAIYLTAAKKLSSQRISGIEFYRTESSLKNLSKAITGVAVESLFIFSFASSLIRILLSVSFGAYLTVD